MWSVRRWRYPVDPVGGTLIIPVGELDDMSLIRIKKSGDGTLTRERLLAVRFVPLLGPHTAHGLA